MNQDDPIHELIRLESADQPKPKSWQAKYRGLADDYYKLTFELRGNGASTRSSARAIIYLPNPRFGGRLGGAE